VLMAAELVRAAFGRYNFLYRAVCFVVGLSEKGKIPGDDPPDPRNVYVAR